MRLLIALLLSLSLLGCTSYVQTTTSNFRVACMVLEGQYGPTICEDLDEPVLVISRVVREHYMNITSNLRGLHYPGENYVFVRSGMTRQETFYTAVHETVHYIVHQKQLELTHCEDEQLSREVVRQVGGPYSSDWTVLYKCTEELK